MKRYNKNFGLISAIGLAVIYLFTAFFQWELSPAIWGKDCRFMLILLSVGWIVIAACIASGIEETRRYEKD